MSTGEIGRFGHQFISQPGKVAELSITSLNYIVIFMKMQHYSFNTLQLGWWLHFMYVCRFIRTVCVYVYAQNKLFHGYGICENYMPMML